MKLRITQLSKPFDHCPALSLDSNRAYRLVFHVNDRPHPRQYIRRRHDNLCVHSVSVDLKQSRILEPGVRGQNTGKAAKLNRLRPLWMPLAQCDGGSALPGGYPTGGLDIASPNVTLFDLRRLRNLARGSLSASAE